MFRAASATGYSSPGIWWLLLLWLFCYRSEAFSQRNKGESCSPSVREPGAGVGWGGDPAVLVPESSPERELCFSHTRCGLGVVRCSRNDSLVQSALPFVFFAQYGPLNWSLRGSVLHQAGQIFVKPMKFTSSWDHLEAGNHHIYKS